MAESKPLPEDTVRLKPFLGMRPGVYLTVLYALLLLGTLFFVLLFPGITNPGSVLSVNSEPQGAAVRVDGVTLGVTPCELALPQGLRVIELALPGFTTLRMEQDIPGSRFASLFFPRRVSLFGALTAPQALEAFVRSAADYARWSFAGEPTAAYQIPRDLSEGAYRLGPAAAADDEFRNDMNEVLEAAARFAVTRAALRDLLRAQFLADNGGLSPSPLSLTDTAATILGYLSENPGAAAWLAETLPPESARIAEGSSWHSRAVSAAAALAASPPAVERTGAADGTILGGEFRNFRPVPGGEFTQAGAFPRRVKLDSFYISATELGGEAWERFLQANPQWRRDNAEALIDQGLASPGYLDDPVNPPYPNAGLPGISWFAAEAYCAWLTASLPPSMAAWEARLPKEAEWEYAASLAAEGTIDLENMLGGFWEWCADPYAPLDCLPAEEAAAAAVSSPERSLRGGSWINPPGSVGITTRASLAPSSSSPFVSFRPALARRTGTKP
ncbi:MAG: SUMF1/EgtB/PvdO family nonheme iron enzyme [Treponema sp.]|nr:SUMF1/EgtB/PvdO family nonheme iron enzyme [Treponema sp.]